MQVNVNIDKEINRERVREGIERQDLERDIKYKERERER